MDLRRRLPLAASGDRRLCAVLAAARIRPARRSFGRRHTPGVALAVGRSGSRRSSATAGERLGAVKQAVGCARCPRPVRTGRRLPSDGRPVASPLHPAEQQSDGEPHQGHGRQQEPRRCRHVDGEERHVHPAAVLGDEEDGEDEGQYVTRPNGPRPLSRRGRRWGRCGDLEVLVLQSVGQCYGIRVAQPAGRVITRTG
jgi:hypothetical protein